MKIVAAVAAVVLVLLAGLTVYLFSGAYNVAATNAHAGVTEWALETVMERSVAQHTDGIEPMAVPDSVVMSNGFIHFHEMCVTCHGAPGVEASEIGKGLNPDPPELSDEAAEWSVGEVYWIVKHGIKMTGMPAFGPTHSEEDLWAIARFVERLPQMSAAEYQGLVDAREAQPAGETHVHADGSTHQH